MGKGIAALSYLPKVDILFPAENAACSTDALKGAALLVSKLQANGTADGTYSDLISKGNSPYSASKWTVVVADSGTTFTCTFVEEETIQSGASGRSALTTRRPVSLVRATGGTFDFNTRSVLALVNFIEKMEDKVAQTADVNAGDGTLTELTLRGFTPFDAFVWTITKLDDVYTVVSTEGS
ncbi:structural protein [Cellulophaga phage Calle_1]|uniref:Structural protein n=1 Tax=Cellulophaga phage Calle_1 TaxID=2745643 RepID=A0A8E4ZKU1_9CAUD|nr:structural protein [Cellulophaga phage Calle_1]QQV89705.1 structural protein [Cellulophaga phage Calle_1]QQV89799.1 structural protein [Cellulophaga phage Calle_2]QQV89920.1 structural protein [Cellulophaga phage Calle_3]